MYRQNATMLTTQPALHPCIFAKRAQAQQQNERDNSFVYFSSFVKLDRHSSLFHAGDNATRLFEVESGALLVYILLSDGRRQVVEIVLPGGICGFSSGDFYTTNCEAVLQTVLRAYRKTDLNRSESLKNHIFLKAELQLCQMHEHAVSLGRKTAQERVATLLSRFVSHADLQENFSLNIDLPLTRGEIGDYLGLSLETVCRTLTALQRRGVISIGRRHGEIVIPNPSHLHRLASLGHNSY